MPERLPTMQINFDSNRYSGGFSPHGRNITTLWLFDCPVLSFFHMMSIGVNAVSEHKTVTYSVLAWRCVWSAQAGSRPVRCTLWSWSPSHVARTISSRERCLLDPVTIASNNSSANVAQELILTLNSKQWSKCNRAQGNAALPPPIYGWMCSATSDCYNARERHTTTDKGPRLK